MSQGPLYPNLTKKVQAEVSQMANHNLSCVILLGGLSVNLNHLKTTWRLLHWKLKEQVRLLKCIQIVCCLANFVYSLFNGKKVQMVRWACWSPLSSTDPNNIGQIWKITCYV